MSKTPRASLTVLLVAAALAAAPALALPPSGQPSEGGLPATGAPGPAGLLEDLWGLVARLFSRSETENRWTIDPNGTSASAQAESVDPDGARSVPVTGNRWTIDPNG